LGSLIILDVDNKKKIHLLDEITSTATKDSYFRVAVNKYRMLLVSQPNIIEEYDLMDIYTKNRVILVKMLPTYGYLIQPGADI
jgi:hypothetical protein